MGEQFTPYLNLLIGLQKVPEHIYKNKRDTLSTSRIEAEGK